MCVCVVWNTIVLGELHDYLNFGCRLWLKNQRVQICIIAGKNAENVTEHISSRKWRGSGLPPKSIVHSPNPTKNFEKFIHGFSSIIPFTYWLTYEQDKYVTSSWSLRCTANIYKHFVIRFRFIIARLQSNAGARYYSTAVVCLSVRPSVCPSVTLQYCIETA